MSDYIFLTKKGKVWRELSCNGSMLDVEGITKSCQYEEGSLMIGGMRANPGLTIKKVRSYMPMKTGCSFQAALDEPLEVSGTPKAPPRTEGQHCGLLAEQCLKLMGECLKLIEYQNAFIAEEKAKK